MMRHRFLSSLLLSFAFLAPATPAAKLKVPAQFPTIQQAVDAAAAGDVVEISAGVYNEQVVVNNKTDLVIRARKKDKVFIDPSNAGVPLTVQASTKITVIGLRVRNSSAEGIRLNTSIDVALEKCVVQNVPANGVFVTSCFPARIEKCTIDAAGTFGVGILSEAVDVVDTLIRNCGSSGIAVLGDQCSIIDNRIESAGIDGIQLGDGTILSRFTLISDNEIVNPASRGIRLTATAENCTLIDNTIQNPAAEGIAVADGASAVVLIGNVVKAAQGDGIRLDADGVVARKNKVKKAAGDGVVVTANASDLLLRKNTVLKSAGTGLNVLSGSHVFVRNVVKKSGAFDLSDAANPGANAYVKNVFGTVAP